MTEGLGFSRRELVGFVLDGIARETGTPRAEIRLAWVPGSRPSSAPHSVCAFRRDGQPLAAPSPTPDTQS